MSGTPAPNEVVGLVERFCRNHDSYLAGGINEAQLRFEFLSRYRKPLAVSCEPITASELCGLMEDEIGIIEKGGKR